MKEELETILANYSTSDRSGLIPLLQDVQEKFGYLSEELIVLVGRHYQMPTSKIYGLATFYNQFRFEPKGKYHIELCSGTACYVEGYTTILAYLEEKTRSKAGHGTRDGSFSIELVPCIGACAFAPAMLVNGKIYARLSLAKIDEILDFYNNKMDENE